MAKQLVATKNDPTDIALIGMLLNVVATKELLDLDWQLTSKRPKKNVIQVPNRRVCVTVCVFGSNQFNATVTIDESMMRYGTTLRSMSVASKERDSRAGPTSTLH